jgi:hypothetical protein
VSRVECTVLFCEYIFELVRLITSMSLYCCLERVTACASLPSSSKPLSVCLFRVKGLVIRTMVKAVELPGRHRSGARLKVDASIRSLLSCFLSHVVIFQTNFQPFLYWPLSCNLLRLLPQNRQHSQMSAQITEVFSAQLKRFFFPPFTNSNPSILGAGLGDGVEEQRQQARQVDVPGAPGGSRHGKLCLTKAVCSSS